jgi:L-gulonolactone oxidase
MSRRAIRNWAGNQSCRPTAIHRPTSAEQVATIVAAAASAGRRVKAIGAGHSFTTAAMTDGELLDLRDLSSVVAVDHDTAQVRVQAGIGLDRLNAHLARVGLAMPNLGDIAVQTIAGAISTATHGTGRALPNLATTVVGLELVDGRGDIVRADCERHPEVLHSARVGVGAMGILTELTLQCVPAFNLRARETVEPLDAVLADFDAFTASADHAEFFWFPGTDRAQVKRNQRTEDSATPPSRVAYVRDKYLFENAGFGLACRIGRRYPAAVPGLTRRIADGAGEREFVDRSDRVFASPRRVRFVEMEYGIPLVAVPEALRRVEALVRSLHHPVMFPIEVRCSAADDIPLSTGYGRENGWIAVHQYRGMEYEHYFRGVESIMADYEGRPHWGKLHGQNAESLRERYPEWAAAMRIRDRLDPLGTFANDYLDRVLDPIDS